MLHSEFLWEQINLVAQVNVLKVSEVIKIGLRLRVLRGIKTHNVLLCPCF